MSHLAYGSIERDIGRQETPVTTLDDLLNDPQWFPATLTDENNTLLFGRVTREGLSGEAFLDQRMAESVSEWQRVPVKDVLAAALNAPEKPPSFIFHSAFCCSTLMARALDQSGTALSLKEPDALMGAGNSWRTPSSQSNAAAITRAAVVLLARRFSTAESIVIKPTNAANNLLPHVVAMGAPTLLLYGDLRSFLISVIKKGEACKAFMRTLYNIFALDTGSLATIPVRQAMTFTDLQVAALVWRHQLQQFQATTASAPPHVRTLNFKAFMDAPAPALFAVSQHLQLTHTRESLDAIAAGPVFQKNSKFDDQSYDPQQRSADAEALESQWGEELDRIEAWERDLELGPAVTLPLASAISIPS